MAIFKVKCVIKFGHYLKKNLIDGVKKMLQRTKHKCFYFFYHFYFRQWMEIQQLRSKMKRKVDTRATKGRKIRYDRFQFKLK